MHLVGFSIEMHYDARSYKRQICVYLVCVYFIDIFKRAALCQVLEILFRTSLNMAHMQQSNIESDECLCKGKGLPITCYEVREGYRYTYSCTRSQSRRQMEEGGQRHASPALPPGKSPCTYCAGGCLGRRNGLDSYGKSRSPPGFEPQTVQPPMSRRTCHLFCVRAVLNFWC